MAPSKHLADASLFVCVLVLCVCEVYVIWLVLSVMLCLCCLTCTTRRSDALPPFPQCPSPLTPSRVLSRSSPYGPLSFSSPLCVCCRCVQEWRVRLGQRSSLSLLGRDDASLYERLLHHADVDAEQEQREAVWRNSLQEDGEEEWQCPVCALHNRPRARVCPLCSTSYDQALALKGLAVGGPVAAAAKASHDNNTNTQAADKKTAKSEGEEGEGEEALTALTLTQLRQLSSRQKKGRRRRLWQLTHTTGQHTHTPGHTQLFTTRPRAAESGAG